MHCTVLELRGNLPGIHTPGPGFHEISTAWNLGILLELINYLHNILKNETAFLFSCVVEIEFYFNLYITKIVLYCHVWKARSILSTFRFEHIPKRAHWKKSTFHLDHILLWSYSKKSTFYIMNEHIPKTAHSKNGTFHFDHIPKRAHSKKEHIPKRAHSILHPFKKEHIPLWTHSKKYSFQKEHIPERTHFILSSIKSRFRFDHIPKKGTFRFNHIAGRFVFKQLLRSVREDFIKKVGKLVG